MTMAVFHQHGQDQMIAQVNLAIQTLRNQDEIEV